MPKKSETPGSRCPEEGRVGRRPPGLTEAAISLLFAFFCRPHMTLNKRAEGRKRTTPTMAAGLTDHAWTIRELIQHVSTSFRRESRRRRRRAPRLLKQRESIWYRPGTKKRVRTTRCSTTRGIMAGPDTMQRFL